MEPLFVPRRLARRGAAGRAAPGPAGPGAAAGAAAARAAPGAAAPEAEVDGWLIASVYDAERGQGNLVIFDAARPLADGPVARIRLPHHLPSGLHGSWSPEFFGEREDEAAAPKWREPGRIRPL
jgi:all-trans-8'-apo-beta-carotenal 15,15'-oxygenase